MRSESRQRTKLVGVRLTPGEYLAVKRRAANARITIPELMRITSLVGLLPKGKDDHEEDALGVAS